MSQVVDLEPTVKVEQASNVILHSSEKPELPVISPPTENLRSSIVEGAEKDIANELGNRWLKFDTFQFKESEVVGADIWHLEFPSDIFKSHFGKYNNFAFLMPYMYFRCDVALRFQVNATRFQVGQLQISYYYAEPQDRKFKLRDNVYSRSQMSHALLSLQTNNPVDISIPYNSPKQYVRTRNCPGVCSSGFVTVRVLVLNRLAVVDSVQNLVNITVFIKISNIKAAGMIPMSIPYKVEAQMFGIFNAVNAGLSIAEKAVNLVKGKQNRDMPRNPNIETVVIPRQSSTWCLGMNTSTNSNLLRLDNFGIGPDDTTNEMKVLDIAKVYGLIHKGEWRNTHVAGTSLGQIIIDPLSWTEPISVAEPNKMATYVLPPVSVVTSLFAYWRGSIEIRFDFIASVFHSGRLLCVFIPGIPEQYGINFDIMGNTYAVEFDLSSEQSFTFQVPFIYDREWSPVQSDNRANEGSFKLGTGVVRLVVLNKLVSMENIKDIVEYNIYIRGGPDFELCVPIAPAIGLGHDRSFIQEDDTVVFKSGYSNVYVGFWRYFNAGKSPILRYGGVSDHVAQISGGDYNSVYSISIGTRVVTLTAGNDKFNFFTCPRIPNDTPRYVACFKSLKEAKAYIQNGALITGSVTGEYKELKKAHLVLQWSGERTKLDEFEFLDIEAQVGESMAPLNLQVNLSSIVFGENFGDLKNLIRRFQRYCDLELTLRANSPYGSTVCRIPLSFAGLKLDFRTMKVANESVNRNRNGTLGVLASGYRFFTGSMRVKLVVSSDNPDLFLFVMHIPEIPCSNHKITVPKEITNQDFIMSGYASFGQAIRLNQVIDLEIPYYLPGDKGLLQRSVSELDDMTVFTSLGYLEVSNLGLLKEDCTISMHVYQAAADDTEFTCFTGFPPMVMIKDLPKVKYSKVQSKIIFEEAQMTVIDHLIEKEITPKTVLYFKSGLRGLYDIKNGRLIIYTKHKSWVFAIAPNYAYYVSDDSGGQLQRRVQGHYAYEQWNRDSMQYYHRRYKYLFLFDWQYLLNPPSEVEAQMHRIPLLGGIASTNDNINLTLDNVRTDVSVAVDHMVDSANSANAVLSGVASDISEVCSDFSGVSTLLKSNIEGPYKRTVESIQETSAKYNRLSDTVESFIDSSRESVENAPEMITRAITSALENLAAKVGDGVEYARALLSQLIHLIRDMTIKTFGVCLAGFIMVTDLASCVTDWGIWTKIETFFRDNGAVVAQWLKTPMEFLEKLVYGHNEQNNDLIEPATEAIEMEIIEAQAGVTVNPLTEYCGVLAALAASVVGVAHYRAPPSYLFKDLFAGMGKFVSFANQLTLFFRNNVTVIYKLMAWFTNILCPNSNLLADIDKQDTLLYNWVKNALVFTDPIYRDHIETEPVLVQEAYKLEIVKKETCVLLQP